jgi:hypothetical protein
MHPAGGLVPGARRDSRHRESTFVRAYRLTARVTTRGLVASRCAPRQLHCQPFSSPSHWTPSPWPTIPIFSRRLRSSPTFLALSALVWQSSTRLGRELINAPSRGLPESAVEPRAAFTRRRRHFRKVPIGDILPFRITPAATTSMALTCRWRSRPQHQKRSLCVPSSISLVFTVVDRL